MTVAEAQKAYDRTREAWMREGPKVSGEQAGFLLADAYCSAKALIYAQAARIAEMEAADAEQQRKLNLLLVEFREMLR